MEQAWAAVDRYVEAKLVPNDEALEAALLANAAAGLPAHDVSPPQGRLLHLLARTCGARRVLEIGTLGGYSTIHLARALPPDGLVVTLEVDTHRAEIARVNLARAASVPRIDLRIGPALDTLPGVEADGLAPFDLFFIDADKESSAEYLGWALRLSRPGAVIVLDNVVRGGAVANPDDPDPRVQGVRRAFDLLATEPRLSATAIQTVGAKGWDGFAVAVVEG